MSMLQGPYIAYGRKFLQCEGDNIVESKRIFEFHLHPSYFNPAKPHELQRLSGNVTLTAQADDSFWVDHTDLYMV